MKSLLAIYMIGTLLVVAGLYWMDGQVNELITVPAQNSPVTHVEDAQTYLDPSDPYIYNTGFNSATDALQTSAGINVYQDGADPQ